MSGIVVECEGITALGRSDGDDLLELRTSGLSANVRCEIDVFRESLPDSITPRLEDFLFLAAYVYSADTRVSRGGRTDVFGAKWARSFRFAAPVSDASFWRKPEVVVALTETLEFLTGDVFDFEFASSSAPRPLQLRFKLEGLAEPLEEPDIAVCFSGGLDSLAAAIFARQKGLRPMLVSHRPISIVDSRQKNLVSILRERDGAWHYPHYSLWVNRKGGSRPPEMTQRSRSFLFTVLAVVAAVSRHVDDVWLCDNGIVSVNLPQSAQNVGTFLSRSTHPRYVRLMERLCRLVVDNPSFRISNTLALHTKKDVVEAIGNHEPALIQEAVSCVHVERRPKAMQHCGTCTQCIDRRFATRAAGLEAFDLPERYERDVLYSGLEEGDQRTHAENYVRFARKLQTLDSPELFLGEYPELLDCLPEDADPDDWSREFWGLFQRHQETVNGVLQALIREKAVEILNGDYPPDSLLGLVLSRQHLVDEQDRYAARLRELLLGTLPTVFQTSQPRDEKALQEAGQAVFQAAGENLARELPLLPFASIGTRPDFSSGAVRGGLFVEFKYVRERRRLNGIITEMTSRVVIYRRQQAAVLFIVYDPSRSIADRGEFAASFESEDQVWVGVCP